MKFNPVLDAPYILDMGDNPIVVGPWRHLLIQDSGNQSLGISTESIVTIYSGSPSSSPALGNPGTDIMVGADEALEIKGITVHLLAEDASGNLQLLNIFCHDVFNQDYQPSVLPIALPYTFAPATGDQVIMHLDIPPGQRIIRWDQDANIGSANWWFRCSMRIKNLSGVAAVPYQRTMIVRYRLISGLDPGVAHVFSPLGQ